MHIFQETKRLVKIEKHYTAKILYNLMIIERDKLYCDLKYSSLHQYLRLELNYSENESTVRVNAVRLMLKSKKAQTNIKSGKLSLTNASKANQAIQHHRVKNDELIDTIIDSGSNISTRKFKQFIAETFESPRQEVIILDARTLDKFDRIKTKYGHPSSYELIQVLLEKELKMPNAPLRVRPRKSKNSRYIPKSTKAIVYTGKCANCGKQYDLEFDHKLKFSHGGDNSPKNIQLLCRSCNQRKEIKARQTNFFA